MSFTNILLCIDGKIPFLNQFYSPLITFPFHMGGDAKGIDDSGGKANISHHISFANS